MRIVLTKGWAEGKKIIEASKSKWKSMSTIKKSIGIPNLENIHPKPTNGFETLPEDEIHKITTPVKVEQEAVKSQEERQAELAAQTK